MNRVDWPALLEERGVPFVTRGPNVKRGELNVRCPFCGAADPSHHMGINLDTGFWACWRNRNHSGKSPVRLLVALLEVPYHEARRIAGFGEDWRDPDGFDTLVDRLRRLDGDTEPVPARPSSVVLPASFRPIAAGGASRRHWAYLLQRGFDDVADLVRRYGLMYEVSGRYADRVILPYVVHGQPVSWTARAIAPSSARYLDQPLDDAAVPPKDTFYNFDALYDRDASTLVVVEGPFDVLKLDYFGAYVGLRAVGMSTSSLSPSQAAWLSERRHAFRNVYVMPDQRPSGMALIDAMRMRDALAHVPGIRTTLPPRGVKDAGEMTREQVVAFATQLVEGE